MKKIEEQKLMIQKLREIYGSPDKPLSYREVESLTGIQFTRVFRIANGKRMYLDEFNRINELIREKESKDIQFSSLVNECFEKLSFQDQVELRSHLERRLRKIQLSSGM